MQQIFLQHKAKKIFGLGVGLFLMATLALIFAAPQTARAAGPGEWQNRGVILFENKTYVLDQALSNGSQQIFTPVGTPTCADVTNTTRPFDYLWLEAISTTRGQHHTIDVNNKDASGAQNCVFNRPLEIVINNPERRSTWFFIENDSTIYSYDKSVSFVKVPGKGGGAADIFYRTGDSDSLCTDTIVRAGGNWFVYPMAQTSTIQTEFPPGKDVISEEYAFYTKKDAAKTNASCRLASHELTGVMHVGSPYTDTKTVNMYNACPQDLPKYIGEISAGFGGGSRQINGYTIACRDIPKDFNTDDHEFTILRVQNGLVAYPPSDFTPIAGKDDGYRIVQGVSTIIPTATPAPAPGSGGTTGSGATRPVCSIDNNFGWMLCPLVSAVDGSLGFIERLIVQFLDVPPLEANDGNPVYRLWNLMRNVANFILIIILLVIVFSQATSVGLNSLGLKRTAGHFIAGGIAANLSFFFCAIWIDFTNITGFGVQAAVQSLVGSAIPFSPQGLDIPADGGGPGAAPAMSILGIGAGVFTMLLKAKGVEVLVAPFLIIALLIVLAVMALILRLALMYGFVIVSPLFAIALILRFTQNFGKKGIVGFAKLGALFPILMFLFGSGQVVAGYLVAIAPKGEGKGIERTVYYGSAIVAKGAFIAAIPAAMATGGALMGAAVAAGVRMAKRGGAAYDNSRGRKLREQARQQNKAQKFYDMAASGKGFMGKTRQRLFRATNFATMTPSARREFNEGLFSAQQKLEDQRMDTSRKAVERAAGPTYAALLAQMRKGESGRDLVQRLQTAGVNIKNPTDAINELDRLKGRFGSQVGESSFQTASLLAALNTGSSVQEVETATAQLANTLYKETGSSLDTNNVMAGLVGQTAKSSGFGSLAYTGVDSNGVYNQYHIKNPEGVAAGVPLNTLESEQIRRNGVFTDFGNGLLASILRDPNVGARRIAEALKYEKIKPDTSDSLRRIAQAAGIEAQVDNILKGP